MRSILSFCALCLLGYHLLACGNEYGYSPEGKKVFTRYFFLTERHTSFDQQQLQEKVKQAREELRSNPGDKETLSNLALYLMKLGRADTSVKILQPLVRENPREYNLVANLGTAYELTGKIDSALKYIQRGLEINQESHFGSEWVHVKILEAKLKDQKQPGWIQENYIISPDEMVARVDTARRGYAMNLNRDIFFQIRTRAPFTPAPNAVLANLLEAAGEFNEAHDTYENALLCYAYAFEFQPLGKLQRRIRYKLIALNQARLEMKDAYEMSDIFIEMMKRTKLDPDLLLMGLDQVAGELDSMHQAQVAIDQILRDSLANIRNQLDSALSNREISEERLFAIESEMAAARVTHYIYLVLGLVLGLGIAFIFRRRR